MQQQIAAVSINFSLGVRLANALVSYMRYIGKMFWSESLSALYPHPGYWPGWQLATASVALLLIFGTGRSFVAKAAKGSQFNPS